MKQIKQLVMHIKDELDDAEQYTESALMYHDTDRSLSDMYIELAKQQLRHKDMQHEQVVRIIKDYQLKGSAVPQAMQAIWDWQHQQMVERQAEVRAMINMYK